MLLALHTDIRGINARTCLRRVRPTATGAATHKAESLLVEVIVLLSFDGDGLRTSSDVDGALTLLLFDSFSLRGLKVGL